MTALGSCQAELLRMTTPGLHFSRPSAQHSLMTSFIGLDVGTTHSRGYLVADGRIVARARESVGIRDAATKGDSTVLHAPLRRLIATLATAQEATAYPPPTTIIAAGMITSELGLRAVPHRPAPVGVDDLAAALQTHHDPAITDLPILLVPGVRSGPLKLPVERIGEADVMRGEETLCVGLLEQQILCPGSVLLNLGSHWKSICIDEAGRIGGSRTTLSGELLQAARTHTLLASALPADWPEELDANWARAGVHEAIASGLEHALFCVRLLEQRSDGTPWDRFAFLAGAFVGSALPHLIAALPAQATVVLASGGGVGEIFVQALREEGIAVRRLSPARVEAALVQGLSRLIAAR